MQRLFAALLCCLAFLAGASVAFGQSPLPSGYTIAIPVTRMASPESRAAILAPTVTPLVPNKAFNFTITASPALGAGVYSGTILGRNPLFNGKTTTTIPTQIVPLIITINDGTTTVTYDPTAPDACIPGNPTDIAVINGSPVFTNNTWVMNGVNVGNTQYIDAFQRAEFWSKVQGTAYHVILSPSTLGAQTLSFGPGQGTNFFSTICGNVGVVNVNALNTIVQNLITGPLASMVNAGTFPLFFTKNVVESSSGIGLTGCCILGFHSGLFVGGNLQIYGLFSIDSAGTFGPGYTNTISHEIAEAVNDPAVDNRTPPWGNIGQVQNACQSNLEVGDPLSPGNPPNDPTNPFTVVGTNGLTYVTQELAFYSWFFGSTDLGVGAGGLYSDNGTFHLPAYFCPPGTPKGGPY